MDFEDIQKKAYKKEPLGEYASLPEAYAYLKMRNLYKEYDYGNLTKEQCVKEKNKIRTEFIGNKATEEVSFNISKKYNQNRQKVETKLYELEKTRDKNEVLKILLDITSKLLADESLYERIICKLNAN